MPDDTSTSSGDGHTLTDEDRALLIRMADTQEIVRRLDAIEERLHIMSTQIEATATYLMRVTAHLDPDRPRRR